jgi:DNA polymerase
MALQEHPDPIIQQLCAVRLGTKSTIEESRIERFIGIGSRNDGMLPIPLKYYGAHTGRWSGQDSVNFQNLPSRDAKKKALKNSVLAPRGHVVINCDSSQIEARVLAWLAEQEDMVEAFRNKRDIYSEFATQVYNRTITKKDPVERFVGKTCILGLGYGTGAAKLQHTLGTAHPVSVRLEEHECKRIVHLYRQANSMIPRFWNDCDRALSWLMSTGANVGKSYYLDNKQVVEITPEGIRLPNRLYIRYPNLRTSGLENGCVYTSRRGVIKIWGGAVTENIVQALARIIVGEQMLKVNERYRTVLTVHDAGVWVVPESEVDDALAFIVKTMSTPPDWCADLPVACEAKYGQSYGDC